MAMRSPTASSAPLEPIKEMHDYNGNVANHVAMDQFVLRFGVTPRTDAPVIHRPCPTLQQARHEWEAQDDSPPQQGPHRRTAAVAC
ncbi:uncharacterized protein BXZ73DRAFT_108814 [Epithele typhae]|uniref:uncharacterized protein n=1 Tax=Epithele typhae TaxID=378194 RepID=UPI002008C10D|nr:uncharacterized protein BXZ73DRAFT_108814 [Epithele typhae]KAH9910555.1 hypothetical protein BXZ73DRAFT_108814 [Epithele typhae]